MDYPKNAASPGIVRGMIILYCENVTPAYRQAELVSRALL